MNIDGTYTLQALPEDVWKCLLDQQTLRRCIPGLERLDALAEQSWEFVLHIKDTPFTGIYQGQAAVLEQRLPHHYRMTFQGDGRQYTFSGEWSMHVSERNGNAVVGYKGSLHFGKRAGNAYITPLLRGVLRLFLQQFFTALTDQLRVSSYMHTAKADEILRNPDDIASSLRLHPPLLTTTPEYAARDTRTQPRRGVLYTVVHQLGLGNGDPLLEEQWVNRIRRVSVASVLLGLVWLGTRLPKRILD
jgi:uncharacterized protein